MLYPRQKIFWRYQVFHHKINLYKVTRHFICNLFYLKWTNAFKYCYYHLTPWEDLKSYLPFNMTNFSLFDFITKHTRCAWWETIHRTKLNNYQFVGSAQQGCNYHFLQKSLFCMFWCILYLYISCKKLHLGVLKLTTKNQYLSYGCKWNHGYVQCKSVVSWVTTLLH